MENQFYKVGQKVSASGNSPYIFYHGVIIDSYTDNGYYYYTVDMGAAKRVFRQKDILLDTEQSDVSTSFQKEYCGKTYAIEVSADNNYITINGNKYKVVNDREFAIKIQKTQIKAIDGALGLRYLFESFNGWEQKIIDNCRPAKK